MPVSSKEPDRIGVSVERQRLKQEYSGIFADLASYFYEYDPVGLNFGVNPDEYEPEVGTILPRVFEAASAAEIAPIIRDGFERWFGVSLGIENATYYELAEGVLEILSRYRS